MALVSTHDADRLGPLLAKPATPGGRGIELVSLADLVAFVASEMNWPRTAAAAHVADKLVAQIIPVDLLLTRPDGGFADVLGPEYAWRKAAPAQAGGVVGSVVQRRGFVQNYGGQSPQPQWVESRKPAKPAVVGIYGAAGALQCLRDAWGADDAGVRARAAHAFGATLQRLAMMRSVAQGLFGCGPALDDGQQRDGGRPPALDDNRMVGWPPAELEGLPPHDAQRWGHDRTQGGQPHDVIRVASLVHLVDRRGAGDVGESLAQVCEALARAKEVRWFVLVRGGAALPLTAGDLWQRAPGAVPAVGVARFFTTPDWFISAGLPPAEVQRAAHGMAPASRGLASLGDWLRAASFDQVDDGEFGALAVPTLLAVELFGQAQEVSQLEDRGAVDEVATDPRIVQPVGGQWPHEPSSEWTDAECEAAFRMRHIKKMTGKELAAVTGGKRQRLDEVIGPAKILIGQSGPVFKGAESMKWAPSVELLAECGWRPQLQPLQNVAVALAKQRA